MLRCGLLWILLASALASPAAAEDHVLHNFRVVPLTDVYYSEGANVGDVDGDGVVDAVYGPNWYRGPDFKEKHAIYPPQAQPRERYADHFFCWLYDFNGDGRSDVFTVGFPGTPAYVYENPGTDGFDEPWPRHEVIDSVCNESPQLIDLVGDERPELVCTNGGYFGYATIDWSQPFSPWTFHRVSEKNAPQPFGHGLGVGDINGDGRTDILAKDGWFEQPEELGQGKWTKHKVRFAGPGGAEMYAYDVDGDGDNDVITSLAAHDFGLAWHEQQRDGDKIAFQQHLIMGSTPQENRYGLVFSELHSVNVTDIDGDGLKDIVTGKTYWSHHTQSPMWDAGAVVYWFKLVRGEDGTIDWIPYRAADETGIGRQLTVAEINGDGLPDMIVGGMKGAHVLLHERQSVSPDEWQKAQPKLTAE
ncbi:MAG: VCBS repeat-containing protein [Planctomycetota bacterium]|nr:MAG: VCBS repeat-containing protein [Planctomycetota bacterium]